MKMSDDKKPSDNSETDESKTESVKTDETKTDNTKKQPFIPLSKQSKHKQNEYHASKRGTWGNLNPATRKPPNPKAYNRRKTGR